MLDRMTSLHHEQQRITNKLVSLKGGSGHIEAHVHEALCPPLPPDNRQPIPILPLHQDQG